ncbi:MAG: TetR/AcrR family transcriptional regulator [Deltaproteobacteria bacterium]|nr:TetR/AcrR family transcriptional regulator [Deltaproteobacteria bacterium]
MVGEPESGLDPPEGSEPAEPAEPLEEGDGRKSRRARQVKRQRRDIVDAAARAFLGAGYAATTMRAIAQEAGFTASSLYSYFESKEAIFAALMERVAEDVLLTFAEPLPKSMAFAQSLELLLLRQLALVEQNHDLFAVMCSQGVFEAKHTTDMRRGATKYIDGLAAWIGAHAGDELKGVTVEEAAYFLWGIQQALFFRWLRHPEQKLRDTVPLALRLFLQGVS